MPLTIVGFWEAQAHRKAGKRVARPEKTDKIKEALALSKKEVESWMKKCPIERLKKVLLKKGVKEAEFERVEKDIRKELEEAIKFAEESPFPNPEDALMDLYAES